MPRRPMWSLLARGTGSWAIGLLCICIYEVGIDVRVPEPSVADGFFLLSYVFMIAGLLAFVRTPAGRLSQLRGAVEGLCIACGFLLCSWSLVLGSVIDSSSEIIETLWTLKSLGVRLAIDDFATGYTSIGNQRNMPVDILKVDRSFIEASNDGAGGLALLEAIVNIGRVLSLVTIAEGIETQQQLATVKELGCSLAQGYLLGRPQPSAEAARLIATHAPSPTRPQLSAWRGAAG